MTRRMKIYKQLFVYIFVCVSTCIVFKIDVRLHAVHRDYVYHVRHQQLFLCIVCFQTVEYIIMFGCLNEYRRCSILQIGTMLCLYSLRVDIF